MGLGQRPCFPIVGTGAVVQQQRRIGGNLVQKRAGHGHAPPGIHGKGAPKSHKLPDGFQIAFGNGGIRRSEGAVVIHSQKNIRERHHCSGSFLCHTNS